MPFPGAAQAANWTFPAAAAAAASKVVVKSFSTGTSTGNVDFTTTDLGGETPKAVMIIGTNATASGTEEARMAFSLGFADDTREGCLANARRDAQANTSIDGELSTDDILIIREDGADVIRAAFSAFTTNGVTLNFATAGESMLFSIIFFAGDNVSAYMDNINFADDNDLDVTDPGFQPDLVFGAWAVQTTTDSVLNGLDMDFGVSDGTTNLGYGNQSEHFVGTSSLNAAVHNDALNDPVDFDTRAFDFTLFDANGFTVDKKGGFGKTNFDIMYLAVAFSDADAWVGQFDSPTTTGNDSQTGPGFTPQIVGIQTNMLQSMDTSITTADAGAFGYSVFDDSGNEISHNWTDEDGVTTSNTSSLMNTGQAIDFNDDGQTQVFAATFSSMDANGWTLNFTTADGTARKWWGWAVEAA